ncbi:SLBB domain-containing protein [Parashewanella hymeniacidonis]|uniref:SLBB domain-containing protein n=1 Tax=Parashewanella hymeniacidonis TaxID=2807618 RepID=UPI0030846085
MFPKAKSLLAAGLTLVALSSVQALAVTPSPQMIEQFKQLPKSEQAKLAKQYGVDLSSLTGGSSANAQVTNPTLVGERKSEKACVEKDSYSAKRQSNEEGLVFCDDTKTKSKFVLNEDGELVVDESEVTDAQQTENAEKAKKLKLFGIELFAGEPSTFAPVSDVPVPSEYMVGPGDTINIQLYGKDSNDYQLTVQRDGAIQFPELGPISLVGLSFAEVKQLLKSKISHSMIGVESNISMGELRSIRIFIAGEAYKPGSYTVSSLSTLTQALYISGGLSDIGSLRNIQLKRKGKLIGALDLYDLLLKGDTSHDLRLQSGDVVFIPAAKAHVSIDGEVRRPAIYELKGKETLADVINMASGIKATGYPQAIALERFNEKHLKTVLSLSLKSASDKNEIIKDGDTIQVKSSSERIDNSIDVVGAVVRPGQYQWKKGIKVADIFQSIWGDLEVTADLDYSLVLRQANAHGDIKVKQFSIGKAINNPTSVNNLTLQPRDQIIIFKYAERGEQLAPVVSKLRKQTRLGEASQLVEVNGNVRFPGVYPIGDKNRVTDLLSAAGGLEEGSYTLSAELTRQNVNPEVGVSLEHKAINIGKALKNDNANNVKLQSRDILTIRTLPDWQETRWVTIQGEVRFPGTYSIQRGETMVDVLERAGGLTHDAFTFGAIFLRDSVKAKEKEQVRKLADELRREIAAKALTKDGGTISFEQAQLMLNQLENIEVIGRLSIDLRGIITGVKDADLQLEANDELYIPSKNQTVSVMGQVQYPSTHRYIANDTFDQYLEMAGGPRKRADENRSYILRANGSVIFPNETWFSNGTQMMAGDTIIVPLDTEYKDTLTVWQQVTSVIYNSAVAVASIARINN